MGERCVRIAEAGGSNPPISIFNSVFYVYVLLCERSSRYYVGSTNDVSRRVAEHNAGKTTSTRSYRPWRLVYTETFETLAEARQREREIKSWKSSRYMETALGLGDRQGERPDQIGKAGGSNPPISTKVDNRQNLSRGGDDQERS